MKVVCDNCRAVYKVPNSKLNKPVNKASCRNCGHRMLIPKPKPGADPNERVLVTAVPPTPDPAAARSEGPATRPLIEDEPEQTVPGRPPSGFPGTPLPAKPRPPSPAAAAPKKAKKKPRRSTQKSKPAPPPREPSPEPAPRRGRGLQVSKVERRATPQPAERAPEERGGLQARVERRGTPMPQGRTSGRRSRAPEEALPQRSATPGVAERRSPDRGLAPGFDIEDTRPGEFDSEGATQVRRIPEELREAQAPPRAPSQQTTVAAPQPAMPPQKDQSQAPLASRKEAPAQPKRTPAPAPPREGFDPSGDLTWAMGATLLALGGAFALTAVNVVNNPMVRVALSGFGLMMSIAGSMGTLLILLDGGRGTRKARPMISLVISGMFSFVLSGLVVMTGVVGIQAMNILNEDDISFEPSGEIAKAQPVVAPTPGKPVPEGSGDAGTSSKKPGPRPRPRPSPRPSSAPSPAPGPAPGEYPPLPAPSMDGTMPSVPPPRPSAPAGVPMDVVEVMLYNNLGVKKCFVPLFKQGDVPPRVDIKFTIQPSGSVSSAGVNQAQLQGGEFEACMRNAVMGVQFPSFEGVEQTLTFPFVLNR